MNDTSSRYLNFNQYWKMPKAGATRPGGVAGAAMTAAHYQKHLDEVKKILAETDSVLYVATVLGALTIFLFIAKVVWDKNISWGWILLTLVLWSLVA
jgi:flagellar motor component MotA